MVADSYHRILASVYVCSYPYRVGIIKVLHNSASLWLQLRALLYSD